MSDLLIKKMLRHSYENISKAIDLISKNEWGESKAYLKKELKRINNMLNFIQGKN